jgi:hypothetical protein
MITEEAYAPYLSKITFDAKNWNEGTWELNNDFHVGPFINYAIIDTQYNRIFSFRRFCYAPSKGETRDHARARIDY